MNVSTLLYKNNEISNDCKNKFHVFNSSINIFTDKIFIKTTIVTNWLF